MSKIMLVEDDKTMLSLLETLLQLEGFEVDKAGDENIETIIVRLCQELPDLALLDVHLRKGNGLDLLRRIRQVPQLKNLRVIMASGLNVKSECLLAGADNFIMKPFMPDDLIKLIHNSLSIN
jgi:DNA-binding response OmpR family regulator